MEREKEMKQFLTLAAGVAAFLCAVMLGDRSILIAGLPFAIAVALFWSYAKMRYGKNVVDQTLVAGAIALALLALLLINSANHRKIENRRWNSYISEHGCRFVETITIGYTDRTYDRFSGESGGEPIEDELYYCRASRKHLTRADFDEGHFGE